MSLARVALLPSSCSQHLVRHRPLVWMSTLRNETPEQRLDRKQQKKDQKAQKRAQRQGHGDPLYGSKKCTLCSRDRHLLIRCQIDKTEHWHMLCGRCWKEQSGNTIDGDKAHPYYRYGGLWKNRVRQDGQSEQEDNELAQMHKDNGQQEISDPD